MNQFDHPNIQWHRVSPKFVMREVVTIIIGVLVWAAIAVALSFIPGMWWLMGAIPALLTAIPLTYVVQRTRAIGYALRQDDLVFRRGLFFSRLVAVPYGRLQMIDVRRGPIDRMLGLSALRTMTAAPMSQVLIPGLPEAEAEQLRDHLIRVAETRRAGL